MSFADDAASGADQAVLDTVEPSDDRDEPVEEKAQEDARSLVARVELIAGLAMMAASVVYVVVFIARSRGNSLWTDEFHSILDFGSNGPLHAATNYNGNNHVLFNVISSMTPGSTFTPWRPRLISYLAVLACDALLIIEFARRRLYFIGGLAVFVLSVNFEWLNLDTQARGYGLVAFTVAMACVAAWRYTETPRRRWLVVSGLATVAAAWTIPVTLFFFVPFWVGLIVALRRRDVFVAAAGVGLGVVAVYAVIVGQVRESFVSYGDQYGRSYVGVGRPIDTLRIYLFNRYTLGFLPPAWLVAVVVVLVLGAAFAMRRSPFPIVFARVSAASIMVFFAICVYLQTPIDRTVSFVVVPFLLIGVNVAASLWNRVGLSGLRVPVPVIFAVAVCAWTAQSTVSLSVPPIEDFRGSAAFVNRFLPDDYAMAAVRDPNFFGAYLRSSHPISYGPDHRAYSAGEQGLFDVFTEQSVERPTTNVSGLAPTAGELLFLQQYGSYTRLLIPPPPTSGVARVTIDGSPADLGRLTDRTGAVVQRSTVGAPGSPMTITVDPAGPGPTRSVFLTLPADAPPVYATATVDTNDGTGIALARSTVITGLSTVAVYVGDRSINHVTITLFPGAPAPPLGLLQTWAYPT